MNRVPKCKECTDLHEYQIGKHTYYDCYNKEVFNVSKKIYAKYIKTSPIWCPLRKKDN